MRGAFVGPAMASERPPKRTGGVLAALVVSAVAGLLGPCGWAKAQLRRAAAPGAPPPWQAGVVSRRVRAAKYDGWRGLSGAHGAPHRWRYYYYCRLTARDISLGTVLFHLRLQGCGAPARVTAPRFGVPPLNQWRQARADAPDLTWRQLPAPAAAPPSAPWTASLASLSSSRARAGAAASWARYR